MPARLMAQVDRHADGVALTCTVIGPRPRAARDFRSLTFGAQASVTASRACWEAYTARLRGVCCAEPAVAWGQGSELPRTLQVRNQGLLGLLEEHAR